MYKISNKADCSDRIIIAIANNGNGLGELVYLDCNDNYIWYCFDTMDTLKQMEIGTVSYDDFEIDLKD